MATKLKLLKDIRYFETAAVPQPSAPFCSDATGVFGLFPDVHRLGQRIACALESEKFSVGASDHVYIALTPALKQDQVVLVGAGFESWQTYVACGLPSEFKTLPTSEKLGHMEAVTFRALSRLNPKSLAALNSVQDRLSRNGAATRILRSSKDTKAYRFEVWFDVPAWQEQAHLYLVARDNQTGQTLQAPPFLLADYEHAFPLVSSITFAKNVISIIPRKSFRESLSTDSYQLPLRFPLASFTPMSRKILRNEIP